ncbi:PucR family transcriptional regulator [Alteribacter natronophilus]|uniref:PucR family transcriptional regulator n=1 Tax=Alteribacter natronophilus TaxID=2583810 RepID=UPI00110F1FEA|nr:helix-turn-helix domain-containing protein [Alteribacter natronophilus]TMW70257.1 hypothetical protein FGB90_16395 [Alteribacter natronophilus]
MLDKVIQKYAYAIADGSEKTVNVLTLQDENGKRVSLKRDLLTGEEESLLQTLFEEPAEQFITPVSKTERLWSGILLEGEIPAGKALSLPVRFIHFSLKGELNDREGFAEAVHSLFSSTEAIVWSGPADGVLVQRLDGDFEDDRPDQRMLDALTGDFYVQISFFAGTPQTEPGLLFEHYRLEKKMFEAARSYSPSQHVFFEREVLAHWLLSSLGKETELILKKQLDNVREDYDLLHSVRVYLECNMNTSMAAKKMFVHRNTLQYRVEKFIEKTSLDIKQFPNAVAAYLMLLALKSKKK